MNVPVKTTNLAGAVLHPVSEYQISKAKRNHRRLYPTCRLCECRASLWGRGLDVHHYVPVHVDRSLGADPGNLITLCRVCHWTVGHLYDWKDYNQCVDATVLNIRAIYHGVAKSGKDEVGDGA